MAARPSLFQRLERLDRRIIFLVVGVAVILPLLFPIGVPLKVSKPAQEFYDAIETIPDGATVLLPLDLDASALPELMPMAIAALKQMWSVRPDGHERNIKVIGFSLWPAGPPIVTRVFDEIAVKQFHKKYGVDYVNLGFKEGREIAMANMGSNFHQVWPKDITGQPIESLPITKDVNRYEDIAYIVDISGGYPGLKEWVQQVVSVYGVKMVGGTTGVSAPEYYPYYEAKQLKGLLEGLSGAAQYEKLVGFKGTATGGMDAQSVGHWTIALFILLGNVLYFAGRAKAKGTR